MSNLSGSDLSAWLVSTGMQGLQIAIEILLALVAGYIGARLVRKGLGYTESVLLNRMAEPGGPTRETEQRVTTLMGLLRTIALAVVWVIVALIILAQLGLNIAPILAGAGILGLAIGFGAQNLVRDVITGFFLILENHVRVGDVAIVNGTGGLVEGITYRVIALRDLSGTVHVFPHGNVSTLSNMTKEWSAYVMDIGVAYKENTDRVAEVMHQVAEELRQDPTFGHAMLGPAEIFGVDAFGDSAVVIKARIRTKPIEQWTIGREYRRRLKKAFDDHRIEIPFPHRTLYFGEASPPFKVQDMARMAAAGSSGDSHDKPAG